MDKRLELTDINEGDPINVVGSFVFRTGQYEHKFTKNERDELEEYLWDKIHDIDVNLFNIQLENYSKDTPVGMPIAYCFNRRARNDRGYTKNRYKILGKPHPECMIIDQGRDKEYQELVNHGEYSSYETRIMQATYRVLQSNDDIKRALDDGFVSLHDEQTYKHYRQSIVKKAKQDIDKNLDRVKKEELRRSSRPLWKRALTQ